MDTAPTASSYPATLDVDYPDRPLNRLLATDRYPPFSLKP